MAPGGEIFRYPQHFGENVLLYGSHEWLPYSKNAVHTKSPNTHPSPHFHPLCPFIIHRIFPFVKSRRKEESIQFPANALHFGGIWIIILCTYRLKSAS